MNQTEIDPNSLGVVVGRFQTPYLHTGHKKLLSKLMDHNEQLVFLGVPGTPMTERDPMDFATRKLMLEKYIPTATILPIMDHISNVGWSENLDKMIFTYSPFKKITIYCGEDGFHTEYSGKYKENIILLEDKDGVRATRLRATCANQTLATQDFRHGVIYASQNMYPRVSPTVDIAPVYFNKDGEYEVLLGRKHGSTSWGFIGGFLERKDNSAEEAALREMHEEAGILATEKDLFYIGTRKIEDWRDTNNSSIITTFFACSVWNKECLAGDDIEEVRWFPYYSAKSIIAEHHLNLLDMLISKNGE